MSYITAIVLAAGSGLRFKSKTPKPLVKINSQPIIIYCLTTLSKHSDISDIIVVVNARNASDIASKIRQHRIAKVSRIVEGGLRRQDSLGKGLQAMDSRTDLVLIHDGARPFIDRETVSRVIKEASCSGAAIVGVPVKPTIKRVTSAVIVKETLDRRHLWEIQTPQVFKKNLILKAYNKFGRAEVTDDSSLVERLGKRVRIIKGRYSNIKITTPEDLIIAKAILNNGLRG